MTPPGGWAMLEETPGMRLDYVLPNSVTHSSAQTLPTNQSERPDFPAPEEPVPGTDSVSSPVLFVKSDFY